MKRIVHTRLKWIQLYEDTGDAGFVAGVAVSPGQHFESGIVVLNSLVLRVLKIKAKNLITVPL
jgi:hypothetical protein